MIPSLFNTTLINETEIMYFSHTDMSDIQETLLPSNIINDSQLSTISDFIFSHLTLVESATTFDDTPLPPSTLATNASELVSGESLNPSLSNIESNQTEFVSETLGSLPFKVSSLTDFFASSELDVDISINATEDSIILETDSVRSFSYPSTLEMVSSIVQSIGNASFTDTLSPSFDDTAVTLLPSELYTATSYVLLENITSDFFSSNSSLFVDNFTSEIYNELSSVFFESDASDFSKAVSTLFWENVTSDTWSPLPSFSSDNFSMDSSVNVSMMSDFVESSMPSDLLNISATGILFASENMNTSTPVLNDSFIFDISETIASTDVSISDVSNFSLSEVTSMERSMEFTTALNEIPSNSILSESVDLLSSTMIFSLNASKMLSSENVSFTDMVSEQILDTISLSINASDSSESLQVSEMPIDFSSEIFSNVTDILPSETLYSGIETLDFSGEISVNVTAVHTIVLSSEFSVNATEILPSIVEFSNSTSFDLESEFSLNATDLYPSEELLSNMGVDMTSGLVENETLTLLPTDLLTSHSFSVNVSDEISQLVSDVYASQSDILDTMLINSTDYSSIVPSESLFYSDNESVPVMTTIDFSPSFSDLFFSEMSYSQFRSSLDASSEFSLNVTEPISSMVMNSLFSENVTKEISSILPTPSLSPTYENFTYSDIIVNTSHLLTVNESDTSSLLIPDQSTLDIVSTFMSLQPENISSTDVTMLSDTPSLPSSFPQIFESSLDPLTNTSMDSESTILLSEFATEILSVTPVLESSLISDAIQNGSVDIESTFLQSEFTSGILSITDTFNSSRTESILPSLDMGSSLISPELTSVLPSFTTIFESRPAVSSNASLGTESSDILSSLSEHLYSTIDETSSMFKDSASVAISDSFHDSLSSISLSSTSDLSSIEPTRSTAMTEISVSVTPSPTTPEPSSSVTSPTSEPNIPNNKNNTAYWILTRLLVRKSVNVSSAAFKNDIEKRLANAYYLALQRRRQVESGTFEPLLRRKRATAAAEDPTTKVEVTEVNREEGTSKVNVAYVAEQEGEMLTPDKAVELMNLLTDQELAIELGQVVSMKAEPYNAVPADDGSDDTLIYIIAGVCAGVVLVVIIIIICCCCCCRGNKRDKVAVTSIQEAGLIEEDVFHVPASITFDLISTFGFKYNKQTHTTMPEPTQGGVQAQHRPSAPSNDEDYYDDDEEEEYDEEEIEEEIEDSEDDDDDDIVAPSHGNKENELHETKSDGKKTTGKKGILKQRREYEDADKDSVSASEDKRSVGSLQRQQVLQQQQQQQQKQPQQQQPRPARSGGLCRGKSDTQVKDTLRPIDKNAPQNTDAETNKTVESKDDVKPVKGSGGLCKGDKNVEIQDSLKPVGQPPSSGEQEKTGQTAAQSTAVKDQQAGGKNETHAKKSGGVCGGRKSVQVEESLSPTEKPNESQKPADQTKQTPKATQQNNKLPESQAQKKSGGLCSGKSNVGTKDSLSPALNPNETSKTKSRDNQTKNVENKPLPQPTKDNANITNQPQKKSGGLCSGKSSVEVKDSLSPVDKTSKSDATKERALPLKGTQNEMEENIDDEEEVTMEDKVPKKKKKKNAKTKEALQKKRATEEKEEFYNDFDQDELTEIYVGPEPPPPTLKKSKKKKKGESSYVKDEPLTIGHRKGKYAVTTAEDGTPIKKKGKSGSPYKEVQDDEGREQSSQKKKKKKKPPSETDSEPDVRSVYEHQLADLEALPLNEETVLFTDSLQPTFEDENELLENAKEERQKNKQRLREKKMREKEFDSPVKEADGVAMAYTNAQREIEKVLQPGDGSEKEDGKKKSKDKKKKKKEGKDNEGYEETEVKETLTQARDRMHKLLDDAFSLISQSHTSIGTKSEKSKKDSDDSGDEKKKKEKSKKSKPDTPPPEKEEEQTQPEEKKHTPLIVQRTHGPYDSSGLITWSPYRAGDEANAIISMPAPQNDQPAYVPKQEKTTTSVFSEKMPDTVKPYYTNEPAEPIFINTQNMDTDIRPYQNTQSLKQTSASDGSYTQGIGATRGTLQNSLHSSAYPYSTMDRYSEPYPGMNSFQEIPQRDTDPMVPGDQRLAASEPFPRARPRTTVPGSRTDGNVIMVQEHRPPQSRERPNLDVADVIYDSMRPGSSPQPLIDSLREELQGMSHRRAAEGDGRHSSTLLEASTRSQGKTNGTTKRHSLLGSREGTPPDL